MSIREKLLSSQSTKFEFLEFPEIQDDDGKSLRVKIKGISYGARMQLLADCFLSEDRLDMVKMMPRAIIATFHDPLNDKPVFTVADADTISGLAPEVIEKARVVIWRVIGLSGEVTEKNSVTEAPASAPASV